MNPFSSGRLDTHFEFPTISGVGNLVSQTFKLYFGNFQWVLFLSLFFTPLLLAKNAFYFFSPPDSKLIKFWIDSSILGLPAIFTAPALVYLLVKGLRDGIKPPVKESLKWGWLCFPRNFGYHFLTGLMTIGGLLLLVVPGVIVMIWYGLLSTVIAVEGTHQQDPMNRSKTLVKKHMGIFFGGALLVFLFNMVAALVTGGMIGFVVGVIKAIIGDQSPFTSPEHWLLNTVIEQISVILNMDMGIVALCGYLSWTQEEPLRQVVEDRAPVEIVPPSSPTPALKPSMSAKPAHKPRPKTRAAAKKPVPKTRGRTKRK